MHCKPKQRIKTHYTKEYSNCGVWVLDLTGSTEVLLTWKMRKPPLSFLWHNDTIWWYRLIQTVLCNRVIILLVITRIFLINIKRSTALVSTTQQCCEMDQMQTPVGDTVSHFSIQILSRSKIVTRNNEPTLSTLSRQVTFPFSRLLPLSLKSVCWSWAWSCGIEWSALQRRNGEEFSVI